LLLYQAPIGALNVMWLGTLLIWIAAVLTVSSMLYYLRKAWPAIAERTGGGL
jgi:CDP-diacylglycerol--glycerol-3-phosphate 3-phosphatidyltransferase/cardiolipin synthase